MYSCDSIAKFSATINQAIREHYSLLTSCLLTCILLAYWLFIDTYNTHYYN